MTTSPTPEQGPLTVTELKARDVGRWLMHRHDGTSSHIRKCLAEAGMREGEGGRMFVWKDGTTFATTRGLVSHILDTAPETIDELYDASMAMQKTIKAKQPPVKAKHSASGLKFTLNRVGVKQELGGWQLEAVGTAGLPPSTAPALGPPEQKHSQRISNKIKREPPPEPSGQPVHKKPAVGAPTLAALTSCPPAPRPAPPAAQPHPPPPPVLAPTPPRPRVVKVEPPPPKASLIDKLVTKLVSGEYVAERTATRQAIAAVLSEPASSPSDLHLPALKHLVQHHRVHPALQAKAGVLLEDYERALEVGAARTLSGLQGAGAGLGGGAAAAPRSDDDLRQDIEALSELLASNSKFTPLALAGLEQQKAALEEELVQRGEQVKNEADFKLQRLSLMEEVKELLEAEDKNLGEVIKTAVELRKLFEYL